MNQTRLTACIVEIGVLRLTPAGRFSLTAAANPVLVFWYRGSFEWYTWFGMEVSTDGGAGWVFDPAWAAKCPQSVHDFLTMGDSPDVWRWMDEHDADVITPRNFLFIWG